MKVALLTGGDDKPYVYGLVGTGPWSKNQLIWKLLVAMVLSFPSGEISLVCDS